MKNKELLENYYNYMISIKRRSDNTVRNYKSDLNGLLKFLENKDIKNITQKDLERYISSLSLKKRSSSTISRKISTIQSFFSYLVKRENVINKNPSIDLEHPTIDKALPIYLEIDEVMEMLKVIDNERDYAIVNIFLNCGLRASELVNLNLDNIKNNTLRINKGKGNKDRIINLNKICIDSINEYLKTRPDINNEALFISRNKNRLSYKAVNKLIKKYVKRAGLDETKYTPHKLRHTAATLMYQAGTDIRTIQEILGHSELSTTQIYTHVGDKQKQDAVNNNPINKMLKSQEVI